MDQKSIQSDEEENDERGILEAIEQEFEDWEPEFDT
jgi:hypothetical protein